MSPPTTSSQTVRLSPRTARALRLMRGPLLWGLSVALLINLFFLESFTIPSPSMEDTLLPGDAVLVNKVAYGFFTPRSVPLLGIPLPFLNLMPGIGAVDRGDVTVFRHTVSRGVDLPSVPTWFVKRCVGLPGDTVELAGKRLYINGNPEPPPSSASFDAFSMRRGEIEPDIFPKGLPFNKDWWGPVVVPYEGMEIHLTYDNLDQWRGFIQAEGHSIRFNTYGQIEIDEHLSSRYVVERDYYFFLGDNRDNSRDSRYWGFVPEREILGEVLVVFWSWDPGTSNSFFRRFTSIRWNRILTFIH